ncbi:MAG: 4-hydroxy-tetrahydrodipicolinate reductase [Firmicutes bacterium]|nr:4-hydroxy-tetrahydrodipicolinate reductase [Bacillota bacterium]
MKVLIAGYGRMGQLIEDTLLTAGHTVPMKIDTEEIAAKKIGVIPPGRLETLGKVADVIMDFSNPSLTDDLIDYALRTGTPLLSGTTNLTKSQHEALAKLGESVPVIWASNYSFGINLFQHILPEITKALKGWDIEVTEIHHNKKVDAPSGTAKTLADAIDPDGAFARVYGREGDCGVRTKKEIGMHSLRGGTVVGEHKVDFFGNDEVFEITHKAGSRQILVDGAITAARRLVIKKPGLYTMEDIIFE